MDAVLETSTTAAGAADSGALGDLRPLSAVARAGVVAELTLMLNAIHRLARGVIETVTREEARLIFVAEQPVVINPLPDPARRPRGSTHPLVTLIKLAVSSARLQIRALKMDDRTEPAEVSALADLVQGLQSMAADLGMDAA